MTHFKKLSATACMVAAMSMAATPAIAADIPVNAAPKPTVQGVVQWDADAENVERHRRHRYRHRNRVDAGDIIAGVLIIGGIAAIADAASRNKRERSYPVDDRRYRDTRYDDRRSNTRSTGGQGIDRAVDMCLREIERDVRVDNVDNVSRTGEGWNVTGTIYNGDSFSCRIGNDGRVENVAFGGRVATTQPVEDRQWDDECYRQARQAVDQEENEPQTAMVETEPTGPQPAYPGGPIDGDLEQDGELGG